MAGKSGAPGSDRPKPNMRNMHRTMMMRNVAMALMSSAVGGITFYILHNKPRQAAFKYFYENYDPEKSFQRMLDAGYFSSCEVEEKKEEPKKK